MEIIGTIGLIGSLITIWVFVESSPKHWSKWKQKRKAKKIPPIMIIDSHHLDEETMEWRTTTTTFVGGKK